MGTFRLRHTRAADLNLLWQFLTIAAYEWNADVAATDSALTSAIQTRPFASTGAPVSRTRRVVRSAIVPVGYPLAWQNDSGPAERNDSGIGHLFDRVVARQISTR